MKETKRLKQFQKYYNYCWANTESFNPWAILVMELKGVKQPKPKYKKETVIPKTKEKEIPITYEEGCYYESRILDWNDYGI